MAIELPKLPVPASAAAESDSLPFATVPLEGVAEAAVGRNGDFETYLNRKRILRLRQQRRTRYFDPAAAILEQSVYRPIRLKSDR